MAIDTIDLHGIACFAVQIPIAVAVALEVAVRAVHPFFEMDVLEVDGFAEFSDPELDLLAGLFPYCEQGTITFCLDRPPTPKTSWLSHWSLTERTLKKCQARFGSIPGSDVRLELLPCRASGHRFINSAALSHLQQSWETPNPFRGAESTAVGDAIKLRVCPHPEAEVTAAAREILRLVRAGGRYREAAHFVFTTCSAVRAI